MEIQERADVSFSDLAYGWESQDSELVKSMDSIVMGYGFKS